MVSMALVKSDLKYVVKRMVARMRGRSAPKLNSRVPPWKIKRMIANNNLAFVEGQVSWFYTAYSRGDEDPLTNHALGWIKENVSKDKAILNTGCGTGIVLYWLIDSGFETVDGFDYLPDCVKVAKEVGKMGRYQTSIWIDDGFDPKHIPRRYDVITMMHWVYSAWNGNYGNQAAADPYSPSVRSDLLQELLSKYVGHLNPGGVMIVELVDDIADRRVPRDHPYLPDLQDKIYPVRHSPDQVRACANGLDLTVERFFTCVSYSHQPRTTYWLRARAPV